MSTTLRFGRKMRLPSTVEIKHELTMMAAADALAIALREQKCSDSEFVEIIEEVQIRYHISRDRANMLLNRFGPKQMNVIEAAQSLNERKHLYKFRNHRPMDLA